jgi:tetratricopeptide (TPR) repeat protein
VKDLTVEQSLLVSLSRNEFVRARELFDQLPSSCIGRRQFYDTLIRSRLSSSQYPGVFLEFMELVKDRSVDLETRVMSCVEGAGVAFRLNDPGRMARVAVAFRMLTRWHGTSPEVLRWRGSIMLNFANLARQAGDPKALGLYQRAVVYLKEHDDLWCQSLAALCRMAVLQDRAEQPTAAEKALREASAISRGNLNHQEVHLATGLIAHNRLRWDEAIEAGAQAVAHATDQSDFHVLVEGHGLLAMAYSASGQYQKAFQHGCRARDLAVRNRLYHLIGSIGVENSYQNHKEG